MNKYRIILKSGRHYVVKVMDLPEAFYKKLFQAAISIYTMAEPNIYNGTNSVVIVQSEVEAIEYLDN